MPHYELICASAYGLGKPDQLVAAFRRCGAEKMAPGQPLARNEDSPFWSLNGPA
jgi:hypothetical protein